MYPFLFPVDVVSPRTDFAVEFFDGRNAFSSQALSGHSKEELMMMTVKRVRNPAVHRGS